MRYWQNIKDETEWDALRQAPAFTEAESDLSHGPVFYFDMDGTLAVFNKNAPMEEVFSRGYFRGLAPHKTVVELANRLYDLGYDVRILSKSVWHAVQEKHDWLNEHMPWISDDKMYFVPVEADKSKFVPHGGMGAVLIDDYNPNLLEWKGTAVKCVTDINNPNDRFFNFPYGNVDAAVAMLKSEVARVTTRQANALTSGDKYELLPEPGTGLSRIRALKDFKLNNGILIHRGDTGGLVSGPDNLSQNGNCWIFGQGCVTENATVKDSAIIEAATLTDNAMAEQSAYAGHGSSIRKNVILTDHAVVCRSSLSGDTRIGGHIRMVGNNSWDHAPAAGQDKKPVEEAEEDIER